MAAFVGKSKNIESLASINVDSTIAQQFCTEIKQFITRNTNFLIATIKVLLVLSNPVVESRILLVGILIFNNTYLILHAVAAHL